MIKILEKWSSESTNKGFDNKKLNKESNSREGSDDEPKVKKDFSLGLMFIKEIENLLVDAVNGHLGGGSRRTHCYSKPYMKRIDALRIPHGYQPTKFHQFDGKRNLNQDVEHIIETCNSAGTGGKLLVK